MSHLESPGAIDDPQGPDSAPISQAPVTVGYTRVSAYRIGELRHSSSPPPADVDLLQLVADLLLAAACADGEVCKRERHSLRKIQARLAGGTVPPWLEGHIIHFDPQTFDLEETARRLRKLPIDQRRYVAELVREVCDANNVFDIEEERFLISVIISLAMEPDDNKDLVVPTALDTGGFAKRAFDVAFAALAVAALSPVLAMVAIGTKLSSPGKVLFKQRRYGKNGAIIEVFKFRSMRATEDGSVVTQAKRGDARITPFGAFLRRTSLDELPQFFNVLLGNMSVVGPRPHAVAHNEQHRTLILEYMLRHKVKPGITGWAQVNGFRGETDTLEKMIRRVECDLEYIRHYSFWFDLKIIWLTVFGRKVRKNAY
jgi:lipopolysaccharide/colanic/teichoic acid biosynthesis glycosyltransferase